MAVYTKLSKVDLQEFLSNSYQYNIMQTDFLKIMMMSKMFITMETVLVDKVLIRSNNKNQEKMTSLILFFIFIYIQEEGKKLQCFQQTTVT